MASRSFDFNSRRVSASCRDEKLYWELRPPRNCANRRKPGIPGGSRLTYIYSEFGRTVYRQGKPVDGELRPGWADHRFLRSARLRSSRIPTSRSFGQLTDEQLPYLEIRRGVKRLRRERSGNRRRISSKQRASYRKSSLLTSAPVYYRQMPVKNPRTRVSGESDKAPIVYA